MAYKFKKKYFIGITAAIIILAANFFFFFDFANLKATTRWFFPAIIIAINVGWMQFWIDFMAELKRQKRVEEKFLDFVRNLESSVKSGIPIPQAMLQASTKDYSELNPHIQKLANQITVGIPIHKALNTFAEDTTNPTVKRAVAIIIEAEASGGDIEKVLESVTTSVEAVKKLKEEQKSEAYSQIVQGYIIYFVFIGIMLLLQIKLFPKLVEMGSSMGGAGMDIGIGLGGGAKGIVDLDQIFFALIMVQGFFAGIMIGTFSEGTMKQGLIHSLTLMTVAALIITTAKGGI
ncbi:type II secretion system F family protein [Candidatus Woesearchaeota archaeon]|nr:type II secretion system F family protein [Candidatus Woesearchaeota archaeon]